MSQVYNIPNTPIYSPLAGLSDLYGMYLKAADQKEDRAYKREQDGKMWDYKDRELADHARATQSTIDYHLGSLGIQAGQLGATADYNKRHLELLADPTTPTNRATLMNAQAAAARAKLEADKLNDEMKWTNAAVGNTGGTGQPDNARSRLFSLTNQVYDILGTPAGYNPYQFNFNNGLGGQ